MTPEQFREHREKLGTQKLVAKALDITSRSIRNYESLEVPRVVELAITNKELKKYLREAKKTIDGGK